MTTIGIAGTKPDGRRLALRLVETGHSVRVWNRTATRMARALAGGAKQSDLAGLAGCDAILLSLTDARPRRRCWTPRGHRWRDGW